MKISDVASYRPTTAQLKRKGASSASGSFADVFSAAENAGGAASAEHAAPTAPASGINPLLALQEVSDEETRRQKAMQLGQTQLQALERLRQALLMGAVPVAALTQLKNALPAQREKVDDPRLKDILDEIELRVAVELAKIEVAQGNYA